MIVTILERGQQIMNVMDLIIQLMKPFMQKFWCAS